MHPKVWGSCGCKFLFCITLNYPDSPDENKKLCAQTFFYSMKELLPCAICQVNYKKSIQKYKIDDSVVRNGRNLTEWLIKLYNDDNRRQGKEEVSFDDIVKKYDS